MTQKIPKRYFRGRPRRLTVPKARLHFCSTCGTCYEDVACPSTKKGAVTHSTPEWCSRVCERFWNQADLQEV